MDTLTTEFVTKLSYILITALLSAITAVVSFGLHKLNAYLAVKMGATKLDEAKKMARTIVRAIEQSPVFKDYDGAKKKEAALKQFMAWTEKMGIQLDYFELDRMLEEAVQEMNSDIIDIVPAEAAG